LVAAVWGEAQGADPVASVAALPLATSIDLHRRAAEALMISLGARPSACRILLEKRYPGMESLRCTFRSFLEIEG
jgi:hypothetical protein